MFSVFWVIIVHIITIVITIIIIAAPLGCHRCWGGLREARPGGKGREREREGKRVGGRSVVQWGGEGEREEKGEREKGR